MAAICHLGFVGGNGETTYEGPFMVAVPCIKIWLWWICSFQPTI